MSFIRLIIIGLVVVSCNQINNSKIAYRITEKDLIPEGITYSSTTNSFYVSSIYKTKIVKIDAKTGDFKDFIPSCLIDLRFLGLITDETHNLLWACGINSKNEKTSKVVKFNLTSGELIKAYSYPDSSANTYNDIVLDRDGNVYFTNYKGNSVYKIDKQSDSISIFFVGMEIEKPNGISISLDNKFLYIASSTKGVRVLDIENHRIIGEPNNVYDSKGIDGLKYYKNSLIGIQNGVEEKSQIKICRYFLDESGTIITGMEIIDQNNPLFDIPTTFVIVKKHLYCIANSQLGKINGPDCEIIDSKQLQDILILKYELREF